MEQHTQHTLLQTRDAALVAGVTPSAIHRAVHEGRLRVAARTASGTRLFVREDVADYRRAVVARQRGRASRATKVARGRAS